MVNVVLSPSPEARILHLFPWVFPQAPSLWHSFWQSGDWLADSSNFPNCSFQTFTSWLLPQYVILISSLFHSSYLLLQLNPDWFNYIIIIIDTIQCLAIIFMYLKGSYSLPGTSLRVLHVIHNLFLLAVLLLFPFYKWGSGNTERLWIY